MLNLNEIISYYPPKLHNFPKWILREYLQYLILQNIFSQKTAKKLCFIWWTSLRIWYWSQRFSEDLDFDNRWLTVEEFEEMTKNVEKMLKLEWYEINIRHIYKWAFHCTIKIPQLLYDNNLASMATENLTIKIDTTPQWFNYEKKQKLVQNFWLLFPINIADEQTLLSMKLSAFFSRIKGRDLFDIVYLLWKTQSPNWDILKEKYNIKNSSQLKQKIAEKNQTLDFTQLQKDIQPFLFDPNNQSVQYFPQIIEQTEFL